MSDDLFDFGFTCVDEHELEAVQQAQQTVTATSETAATYEQRLDKLYNAIAPLLNNLKMNPSKEYILWPNRLEKIEAFEDKLQAIYNGS